MTGDEAGLTEQTDRAGCFARRFPDVATVDAEHPEEDEVVSDVFQKGYRFKGALIRPARVRVKKYEA